MSEHSYHHLLKSTLENALLHLYSKVSVSRSFITEDQRNKIIIDFLKPKIKQDEYSPIKKNLKTICLMKNRFGSIENHLNGIQRQYSEIASKNDVDKLYSLLEHFERVGIDTKLIEETTTQEVDVVYLDRSHIDNCFDDENRQVAPISLFIHTNELDKFAACLKEQLYFKFAQYQQNEELDTYHYQLHPIR